MVTVGACDSTHLHPKPTGPGMASLAISQPSSRCEPSGQADLTVRVVESASTVTTLGTLQRSSVEFLFILQGLAD